LSHHNKLIVIIGPTAIGKTALGIKIASHFKSEIISCDSRQFFKEMSIGTAVPSKEELLMIQHHFIQNKSVFENYNVGDFENDALKRLETLFQKNNIQVMVGGSGLYVDAVLKGLDYFPTVTDEVKHQVRENLAVLGLEYLQNKLQELDPEYFEELSLHNPQTLKNPQRMTRFVEVSMSSGLPYSHFLKKDKPERPFETIIIGLQGNREEMYERINQRVDIMIANGLIAEAEKLYEYRKLNALQTVGYKEIFEFLDRKISLAEAIEQIKMNTRRFAKRQMTWFQRTENTQWFDYQSEVDLIISSIEKKINH
jgi:tRNA dimethylallyltransferase